MNIEALISMKLPWRNYGEELPIYPQTVRLAPVLEELAVSATLSTSHSLSY
jgi:hypothetical protein